MAPGLRCNISHLHANVVHKILFDKGTTFITMDNLQMAYEVFDELVMYYRTTLFADKAKFELGLIDLTVGRYEKADAFFIALCYSS